MENVEFRRNKDTGILESWKGDKFIGSIITMGDQIVGVVPKLPYFISLQEKEREVSKPCETTI